MTRVGILQSNYLPWRGYFDLMDDCDVFIIYDEVQYTKNDWRNRNKLKTRTGTTWMTVPVHRDGLETRIDEARINWERDWPEDHRRLITEHYRDAPHLHDVLEMLDAAWLRRDPLLSALNVDLLRSVAGRLGIKTRIVSSSELPGGEGKTGRLVALVRVVGGTTYLSGPSAAAYLDLAVFRDAGIAVEYKAYDYGPYPQLWGDFDGAVSVVDLLMNTGPDARAHLKSRAANQPAAS